MLSNITTLSASAGLVVSVFTAWAFMTRSMNRRIDAKVDERLISAQLETIKEKFKNIDTQIDSDKKVLAGQVSAVFDQIIDLIEEKFKTVNEKFNTVDRQIDSNKTLVASQMSNLIEQFSQLRKDIKEDIRSLSK